MGNKRHRNKVPSVTISTAAVKPSKLSTIANYAKSTSGILLLILTITSSIAGIVSLIYYFKDKTLNSQTGIIHPPSDATVKYLSVGSTRYTINSPDGVFIRDGDKPVFTMNLKQGKLLVTTTMRDEKGDVVAELNNNEWQVNKNNVFDRNYTDSALEVRDQSGKVTLQVVHFGDTIHLAGIFRCRSGWSSAFITNPEGGSSIDIRPPGVEHPRSIQPIFEYPSERHFGSCPGLDSLESIIVHGPGPAYMLGGSLDICSQKSH